MKDWIKKLDDSDIKTLFKWSKELPEIPGDKIRDMAASLKKNTKAQKRARRNEIIAIVTYPLAAVLIIAVMLPLILLFTKPARLSSPVIFLEGTVSVMRGTARRPLVVGDELQTGDTLSLSQDSRMIVQAMNRYHIKMVQKGEAAITAMNRKRISWHLAQGIIVAKDSGRQHASSFDIHTEDLRIEPVGTYFAVLKDEATRVAVKEGKVRVYFKKAQGENNSILINSGQMLVYNSPKEFSIIGIPPDVDTLFQDFMPGGITEISSSGFLVVETGLKESQLMLPDNTFSFNDTIGLAYPPGEYPVIVERSGYQPYTQTIQLHSRETVRLSITLQKDISEQENITAKVRDLTWHWKKIHLHNNEDNPEENQILGFTGTQEYTAALTKTGIIGFDKTGRLLWEKKYGQNKGIVFDSRPAVSGDWLYVSAKEKLISIHLKTGKEKIIPAPGTVIFGFSIIEYKGLLYIPYAPGVFAFDPGTGEFDLSHVLTTPNPVAPLVMDEYILLASFISEKMSLFSSPGTQIKDHTLKNKVQAPPVFTGKYIVAGDLEGNLYRFSKDLEQEQILTLSGSVNSFCIMGEPDTVFCFCNDGVLYYIDLHTLSIKKSIPVDGKAARHQTVYYYKSPAVKGDTLYIGTTAGEILMISVSDAEIRQRITVSGAPVSCTPQVLDNRVFVGTIDGEIILMELR